MGFGRRGYQGGGQGGGQGGYQGGGRGDGSNQGGGRGRGSGGSYRGRGGGRGTYNNSQQSNGAVAGLAIKNWSNAKGDKDSLLGWLSRNAGGGEIISHELVGARQNVLIIGVHANDKDNFLRLNNRNWAGTVLVVENSNRAPPQNHANGGQNQNHNNNNQLARQNNTGFGSNYNSNNNRNDTFTHSVQDTIEQVLRSRYMESDKHLDLRGLVNDSAILSIPDIGTTEPAKIWEAIFTVCKTRIWFKNHDRNIAVPTITLQSNNLGTVDAIKSLARIFPRLRNLDLSDNNFATLEALTAFKNEFQDLEHIIVDKNGFGSSPEIFAALKLEFPKLKQINNLPADGSQGYGSNVVAVTAPGQAATVFPTAPPDQCVPALIRNLAPDRQPHPELAADSLFAMPAPDKPEDILKAEQVGLEVSLNTNMKLIHTEELLRANDWNPHRAMTQFQDLVRQNQIPHGWFMNRTS